MKVISVKEFLDNKEFYIDEIIKGKIFLYPTDTIYGIGCNANLPKSTQKINEIKKRELKPLSIIAPSKDWIEKNYMINNKEYLDLLPGKYTLILKKQDKNFLNFLNNGIENTGIRIPKNKVCEIIRESKVPFITTSVNISGKPHITKIDQINNKIRDNVDYIIDSGIIDEKPSTIYDLTLDIPKKIR